LRVHLRRLEEMEYLLVRRGGQGLSYEYQLRMEESYAYDANFAGANGDFAGGARAGSGWVAGGARGEESPALTRPNGVFRQNPEKNTYRESEEENRVVPVTGKPNGAAAGAK
jgi:hypothetical protein